MWHCFYGFIWVCISAEIRLAEFTSQIMNFVSISEICTVEMLNEKSLVEKDKFYSSDFFSFFKLLSNYFERYT